MVPKQLIKHFQQNQQLKNDNVSLWLSTCTIRRKYLLASKCIIYYELTMSYVITVNEQKYKSFITKIKLHISSISLNV